MNTDTPFLTPSVILFFCIPWPSPSLSLPPSLCYNPYFPFSDFDAYLLHADMDIALDSACRLSDYQCKNQVSQHILLLV